MKRALVSKDWATALNRVVDGENKAPNQHVYNSSPDDVKRNQVLRFRLMQEAIDDELVNEQLADQRNKRIERDGAFESKNRLIRLHDHLDRAFRTTRIRSTLLTLALFKLNIVFISHQTF